MTIRTDELQWDLVSDPLPAEAAIVDEQLDRFNQQAADLGAVRRFGCLARSATGTVVGGVLARRWGACCELQQLWVDEAYRAQGIGSELVRRIEDQARRSGCSLVYLETFSFQAPEFYLRLGYEFACEFPGFPDGICKFIMRKELLANPNQPGPPG